MESSIATRFRVAFSFIADFNQTERNPKDASETQTQIRAFQIKSRKNNKINVKQYLYLNKNISTSTLFNENTKNLPAFQTREPLPEPPQVTLKPSDLF